MARRRAGYPQVAPRARDLVTRRLVVVPAGTAIEEAGRAAARVAGPERRPVLVVARAPGRAWQVAPADVLARAARFRLGRARLGAVSWGVPALAASAPEAAVRRRLGPATPFVLVVDAGRPVGAVEREPEAPGGLPRSVAAGLDALDPSVREVLATAGRLGAEAGWPVALVGGLVRDLLGDRATAAPRDVDLVVEGDARRLARRVAAALGGAVREHAAFQTASVTLGDGRTIDFATARRERYRAPGALPEVEPATLGEDLRRRDFSVNAMAARLEAAAWGDLVDVEGGAADLRRRVIRVLHPLSFVEDPTRIFRAARFASRLGFRLDATTARLARAAGGLDCYEALSADRLGAELDAALAEPDPADVLRRLLALGAFRLGSPRYRMSPATEALIRRVSERTRSVPLAPETVRLLHVLALTAGLGPAAATAWAERFGLPAPARAMAARAREGAPSLVSRLTRTPAADDAYGLLRGQPEPVAAWAAVIARAGRARRHLAAHLGRWRVLRPLLSGDDLQAMGVAPGPRLGALLDDLRAAQAAGRLAGRGEARAWVRRALARGAAGGNGSGPHGGRRHE
jgi:tRNA nucleotidyltransferase (CCA-adding enzyme)